MVRILHICHGYCRVIDAVVDNSIHRYCHAVFGQHLKIKYIMEMLGGLFVCCRFLHQGAIVRGPVTS